MSSIQAYADEFQRQGFTVVRQALSPAQAAQVQGRCGKSSRGAGGRLWPYFENHDVSARRNFRTIAGPHTCSRSGRTDFGRQLSRDCEHSDRNAQAYRHQRFYPFINYTMPQSIIDRANPRRKRLLGLHPRGPYG